MPFMMCQLCQLNENLFRGPDGHTLMNRWMSYKKQYFHCATKSVSAISSWGLNHEERSKLSGHCCKAQSHFFSPGAHINSYPVLPARHGSA